ncbi:hypothetical protein V1260_12745 [Brachybacterium sp. J144]|uniref:hypothetical protein n=1 Tax=Brachybacterium sp. J144 TaxID=3116487 RepID=UPI002E788BA2|nr:hypothetical protein [Brachybacterium sp. J144]MEE1651650.1 hypothetical protein [Brachybacterium sp. J144]
MTSSTDATPLPDDDRPTRTFGPPAPVVLGTLGVALVFVIVLEFLVIISFVGQRLWTVPALRESFLFQLPLLLWALVVIASVVGVLRVLTAWLQVDSDGFTLRGLARRTRSARWDEVGGVLAVRAIERGAGSDEGLDLSETAYDGVYLLDAEGHRLVAVSNRFFGPRAQEACLRHAAAAGVRIDRIDAISPAELRRQAPWALGVVDRHPTLVALCLAVFYIGHNVLTFAVWGL